MYREQAKAQIRAIFTQVLPCFVKGRRSLARGKFFYRVALSYISRPDRSTDAAGALTNNLQLPTVSFLDACKISFAHTTSPSIHRCADPSIISCRGTEVPARNTPHHPTHTIHTTVYMQQYCFSMNTTNSPHYTHRRTRRSKSKQRIPVVLFPRNNAYTRPTPHPRSTASRDTTTGQQSRIRLCSHTGTSLTRQGIRLCSTPGCRKSQRSYLPEKSLPT
jgi:hypothetical protein